MHSDQAGDDRTRGDAVDEGAELIASTDDVETLASRIVKGLDLDLTVTVRDEGESIEVDVAGPDRDYLLDRRGEPLNALQYLLNRIVYRGRRGRKIHVDSDGFRRVREDEIVEIALRTADKVKARDEECVMSPLNPYERRLVHMALGEIDGVATRSIGDGFLKRVAIFPDRGSDPGNTQPES